MEQTKDTISFSGEMLIPGFSIYLMEITIEGVYEEQPGQTPKKWYYIGMTGDNYYPSARSAFHRISGHLELLDRSTQNQLHKRICELLDNSSYEDKTFADIWIKMKRFNVLTYNTEFWQEYRLENKFSRENMRNLLHGEGDEARKYREFKQEQSRVAQLEKQLIAYARAVLPEGHLFNKGKQIRDLESTRNLVEDDFQEVASKVCSFMKIDW